MRKVRPPLSLIVFDFNYDVPSTRSRKIRGCSKGLGITRILTAILQKIDRVDEKVEWVKEMLGKLEQSWPNV